MNAPARPSSFWATVKAVAWSFLGVRRSKDFQDDVTQLKPYHIIAAGLAGGIIFVLTLIMLVRWIAA
jgi:hypothetical protein